MHGLFYSDNSLRSCNFFIYFLLKPKVSLLKYFWHWQFISLSFPFFYRRFYYHSLPTLTQLQEFIEMEKEHFCWREMFERCKELFNYNWQEDKEHLLNAKEVLICGIQTR